MGKDDLQLGKVDGNIIHIHRVRIFQTHPVAARHTASHASLPCVEKRDTALFGNRLIEWVSHAVICEKPLHCRVELEPFNTVLTHQPLGLAHSHFAFPRVDRSELDQDITVLGNGLINLVVIITAIARFTFGIDRKDHRCDVLFAVVLGRLMDRWRVAPWRTKIAGHGGLQIIIPIIRVAAAGLFCMGVNVDGADFG